MNIKKSIIPAQKRLNFQKLSQIQIGKLYFSPTFQKVELRNSTFFQQYTHFFVGKSCGRRILLRGSLRNLHLWTPVKSITESSVIESPENHDKINTCPAS